MATRMNSIDLAHTKKFHSMDFDGGNKVVGSSNRKINTIFGGPLYMDVNDIQWRTEDKKPIANAAIIKQAPKEKAKEETTAATSSFFNLATKAACKLQQKKLPSILVCLKIPISLALTT